MYRKPAIHLQYRHSCRRCDRRSFLIIWLLLFYSPCTSNQNCDIRKPLQSNQSSTFITDLSKLQLFSEWRKWDFGRAEKRRMWPAKTRKTFLSKRRLVTESHFFVTLRLSREDMVDMQGHTHRCSPSYPRACDHSHWFAYAACLLVLPHHTLPRLIVMGPESQETYVAVTTSMRFARFSSQGRVLL